MMSPALRTTGQVLLVGVGLLLPGWAGAAGAFDDFVRRYGRSYRPGSAEYERRKAAFEVRLLEIERHNNQSGRSWTAGVNHLADWTQGEFTKLLGWRSTAPHGTSPANAGLVQDEAIESNVRLAGSVEWGDKLSSLSHVRDQGGCGSCWAVCAATMLESRYEAQMGSNRTFSEQELVDCVPNPHKCGGSGGCEGATVELAMEHVEKHGLHTTEEQPYEGMAHACADSAGMLQLGEGGWGVVKSHSSGAAAVGLAGWRVLPMNRARPLMLALLSGPVAVSVSADSWMAYQDGVLDCPRDVVINHAVTLTGYGKDEALGQNYWKIRNSWGESWGESGNIRILRQPTIKQDDEFCGTDDDPAEGIECEPYPRRVTVCGVCGILYNSVTASFGEPRRLLPSKGAVRQASLRGATAA